MTSIAFIAGLLPLVFANGAGASGHHSLGTAVVGGMLVSTALNPIDHTLRANNISMMIRNQTNITRQ